MDTEKPAEFDGPTITINRVHERDACSYYLAHSFGSIYQWSTDFEHARKVFDDLRNAKKDSTRVFEQALERWRRFEEISSSTRSGPFAKPVMSRRLSRIPYFSEPTSRR
jgi:hypothetical protein